MADALDRSSVTPLYEQLAAIMREHISDGSWTGRISSEWDLADIYGVSRPTVRKAASLLVAEGLIGISKGRGMYVLKR